MATRNPCTVEPDLCTAKPNLCTVGRNLCTVEPDLCTARVNLRTNKRNLRTEKPRRGKHEWNYLPALRRRRNPLTSLRLGPPSAVTYAQHIASRRLSMRFNSPRSDAEFTTAAANLLDYATANMTAGPHPRLAGRDDPN